MGSKERSPQTSAGFPSLWPESGPRGNPAACGQCRPAVLQPRELRDRLSYPKTALPGTPNGRGRESSTHTLTRNVHTRHVTFFHMCAHTAWLIHSHAMGWSHQHAFACNTHTHTTCSHTTHSPTRHALLFMYTCSKCMLTHSHYTHAYTHTCTHMAGWTHTDPQSRTCVLPKMLRSIHAQTENAGRTTEKQAQTPPHP